MSRRAERVAAIAASGLLLVACASAPPGEDDKGRDLVAQSTPVLAALNRYQRDRREFPSSLHELVPRYLKEVPFDPGLRYDRDENTLGFAYLTPWPQGRTVVCIARFGDTAFKCNE